MEADFNSISSFDINRIVRMDYGSDEFYAEFAHSALSAWREWNKEDLARGEQQVPLCQNRSTKNVVYHAQSLFDAADNQFSLSETIYLDLHRLIQIFRESGILIVTTRDMESGGYEMESFRTMTSAGARVQRLSQSAGLFIAIVINIVISNEIYDTIELLLDVLFFLSSGSFVGDRFVSWSSSSFIDGYYNADAGWADSAATVMRMARSARLDALAM